VHVESPGGRRVTTTTTTTTITTTAAATQFKVDLNVASVALREKWKADLIGVCDAVTERSNVFEVCASI